MAKRGNTQQSNRSRQKGIFGGFKSLPLRKKIAPIGVALLGLLVLLGLGTFAYDQIGGSVMGSSCTSKQYRRGSSGTCVKHIQTLVNASGAANLALDSSFGPATEKGVRAFQSARKIGVDGIVGPITWSNLCTVSGNAATKKSAGCPSHTYTTTTTTTTPKTTTSTATSSTKCVSSSYRRGSNGTCVKYIQELLNASGNAKVSVDSSFGPATETGIRAFQTARKIKIDGVVGPSTWSHLCGVSGASSAKSSAGCYNITTYSASAGASVPNNISPTSSTKPKPRCVAQTYKRGSSGDCVRSIQQLLNASPDARVTVDGRYGPATETGIRSFQRARNLKIDGVVSSMVWRNLCGVDGASSAKNAAACSTISAIKPPAQPKSSGASIPSSGAWRKPAEGRLSDYYGTPRSGGRTHDGIDLANVTGTPIRAAAAGTVQRVYYSDGCGNVIIIIHSGGISTKYCHLHSVGVRQGAQVSAGQVIGAMGNTGVSSGPHLHFVVMRNGSPTNPLPFLRERGVSI